MTFFVYFYILLCSCKRKFLASDARPKSHFFLTRLYSKFTENGKMGSQYIKKYSGCQLFEPKEVYKPIMIFISMNKYAKTAEKLFVGMPNSKLPTNFQLSIFIFEARVILQTLLQSLKQKAESRPG